MLELKRAEGLYEIRKSKIHHKGFFATRTIEEGTRIIEYVGEKITKSESERRGNTLLEEANKKGGSAVYLFELNKRYDLDGNVSDNVARHINHSCAPNCESQMIRGRIWIVALRDIARGEELSYDYGYNLQNFLDHPCKCGAPECVGYIVAEAERKKLKRILVKDALLAQETIR